MNGTCRESDIRASSLLTSRKIHRNTLAYAKKSNYANESRIRKYDRNFFFVFFQKFLCLFGLCTRYRFSYRQRTDPQKHFLLRLSSFFIKYLSLSLSSITREIQCTIIQNSFDPSLFLSLHIVRFILTFAYYFNPFFILVSRRATVETMIRFSIPQSRSVTRTNYSSNSQFRPSYE